MLTFPGCPNCLAERDYARSEGLDFETETLRPLNTALFMQVLLAIHTQPERWNQTSFFGQQDCGTTMCLAGWTLTLGGDGKRTDNSYSYAAQDLLNLTDDEREHLFFHLQTDDLTVLTSAVHTVLANRGLLATKELTDACTAV